MKKLMLVAVLFLGGCSFSTESFFQDGKIHCINGYLYLVMDGMLIIGTDENDEPVECGKKQQEPTPTLKGEKKDLAQSYP